MSYPELERALALFATDAGFSLALSDRLLQRLLAEPGATQKLRRELQDATHDPQAPWSALLSNDRYEVTDVQDPLQARDAVLDLLWDALYPELPPRGADLSVYEACRVAESKDSGPYLLRDTQTGKSLAGMSLIARRGGTLYVEYEPLADYPMPATMRKLVRSVIPSLASSEAEYEGACEIDLVDTKHGVRVVLPR